jgi:hypothetical protein
MLLLFSRFVAQGSDLNCRATRTIHPLLFQLVQAITNEPTVADSPALYAERKATRLIEAEKGCIAREHGSTKDLLISDFDRPSRR